MNTEEETGDSEEESSKDEAPPVLIRRKYRSRKTSTTIKMLIEIGENIKTSGSAIALFALFTMLFKGRK